MAPSGQHSLRGAGALPPAAGWLPRPRGVSRGFGGRAWKFVSTGRRSPSTPPASVEPEQPPGIRSPDDDEVTFHLEPFPREHPVDVDTGGDFVAVLVSEIPVEVTGERVVVDELAHEIAGDRVDVDGGDGGDVLELDPVLAR